MATLWANFRRNWATFSLTSSNTEWGQKNRLVVNIYVTYTSIKKVNFDHSKRGFVFLN